MVCLMTGVLYGMSNDWCFYGLSNDRCFVWFVEMFYLELCMENTRIYNGQNPNLK